MTVGSSGQDRMLFIVAVAGRHRRIKLDRNCEYY